MQGGSVARIYARADEFKQQVEAQELRDLLQLTQAYQGTLEALLPEALSFAESVQGQDLEPKDIIKLARYQSLLQQMQDAYGNLTGQALGQGHAQQTTLTQLGVEHALRLIEQAHLDAGVVADLSAFNQVPTQALQTLVGTTTGGPLYDLLNENGSAGYQQAAQVLQQGLALGLHPRAIAKQLQQAFGSNLDRALRIVRTETLRAYREASRQAYLANRHIVRGYVRLAAKNERTCIACLVKDGTFYSLDTPLDEHPNGRCALVPVTRYYQPQAVNGAQWFAQQPEGVQAAMLGPAKFEAWANGASLEEFIYLHKSPVWGNSWVTR